MRKVERVVVAVVKAFLHAGILGEDGLMRNTTCTAIRNVHRQHGLANPAEDETVRLGLRRTFGTAPGASNGR